MNANQRSACGAMAAAMLVGLVPGCRQQGGRAEKAAKELDKAVEKVGQRIEKAGDAIQAAANGLGES